MTQLLGTGEVPIKSGVISGPNAYPIPVTFVDERGVVTGVCIGGLTKRQELAARFLPAALSAQNTDECSWPEIKKNAIGVAIEMADELLAATEPKPS